MRCLTEGVVKVGTMAQRDAHPSDGRSSVPDLDTLVTGAQGDNYKSCFRERAVADVFITRLLMLSAEDASDH